ncbi:MAG: tRNA (guanosine(37)-N1)-methyltransferase TrmD, partial [Acidimicrobiia bacterium]|nr:tRNA (guanosine(37)-N1)-methyltransferase TrmD [Acidimicrobiia bacterium]
MEIHVISIFPEFFDSPLRTSLLSRAQAEGHLIVEIHDPRDHGDGPHRQVDDAPFGGGAGMVMMIEPLAKTLEPLADSHKILLT